MGGVEYQVTKVDPTDPETKGMVYQVHKVSEEIAATLGGKVYRARIIKDPTKPTVAGKVYQIVLIDDPDDPSVKGKVYNAILTGGSEAVVVGPAVSPLSLPDAVAGDLDYVKAFGGTTQNGTPTPDAPVDIVSNNGVLKARHQSGLPLGYTLLEYVRLIGASISLQIAGFDDATSEIYMGWKTDAASISINYQAVFAVWTDNQHNSWRMLTYLTDVDKYYVYGNSKTPTIASDVALDTWHDLVCKSGQFIIDNTTYNTTVTSDLTVSTKSITVGSARLESYYKYVKIKRQGEWIANFVPAKRNSDGMAGLYDLINNRFIGSSAFTAGPEVSDVEIYTDGTVETINVHGKNLFDKNSYTEINAYVNANTGVLTQGSPGANTQYCAVIPCKPNTTYTISGRSTSAWGAFTSSNIGTTATSYNKIVNGSITTGANDIYLIGLLRANSDAVDYRDTLQVEEGSTATAYQPYYDGGTATAETLLKVSDYQDVQEILSGTVTRNIKALVLDGTEDWVEAGTSGANSYRFTLNLDTPSTTDVTALCTHIDRIIQSNTTSQSDRPCIRFNTSGSSIAWYESDNTTTLAQFKQWLADQYAAGTPVIVVYPLETPTTESVAGQTLQVTDGDNVLEITQASLTGLELEAEYEKEA